MSDKREKLEEDFDDIVEIDESDEPEISLVEDKPVQKTPAYKHHERELNDDYWIVRGDPTDAASAYQAWARAQDEVSLSAVQQEIEEYYLQKFYPTSTTKLSHMGGWYGADEDDRTFIKQIRIHDRETLTKYLIEEPVNVLSYYPKMDNETLAATLEIFAADFSVFKQSPKLMLKLSAAARNIFERKNITFNWGCLADLSYNVAHSDYPLAMTSVGIKRRDILANSLQQLRLRDYSARLNIKRQLLSRAEYLCPTKSIIYKRAQQVGVAADILSPVFVDDLLLGETYFALQQSQATDKKETLDAHNKMRNRIIKSLSKSDILSMLEQASRYDMSSIDSPNSSLKFFIDSMDAGGRGDDLVDVLSNLDTIKKADLAHPDISIPLALQTTINPISHALFSITYRRDLKLSDIVNTGDPKRLAWSVHSYGFDWQETREALLQPNTNPELIERLNRRLQGATYWTYDSLDKIKAGFVDLENKSERIQPRFLTEEQQNKYLPALCTSILKTIEIRETTKKQGLLEGYPELEKYLPQPLRTVDRFPLNLIEKTPSSGKHHATPLLRNWIPETRTSFGEGKSALQELLKSQSQQLVR